MLENMDNLGVSKKLIKHCRFFLTESGCRFGENCKYEHLKLDVAGVNLESTVNDRKEGTSLQKGPMASNDHSELCTSDDKFSKVSSSEIQKKKGVVEIDEEATKVAEGVVSEQISPAQYLEEKEISRENVANDGAIDDSSRFHKENVKENTSTKEMPLCRFFKTKRGCLRGENCKYSHAERQRKTVTLVTDERKNCNLENQNKTQENNMVKTSVETEKTDRKGIQRLGQSKRTYPRPIFKKPGLATEAKLSSLSNLELQGLRKVEIKQIHKRFGPQGKLKILKDEEDAVFEILFVPTDPDWPFDVAEIVLCAQFDKDYPKKMFCCNLSEDQELPQQLISHVNGGIKKWISSHEEARQSKDTVELPFRPFLRWLDRNLETLFIEAGRKMKMHEEAQAAGLEFVPYHFLAAENSQKNTAKSSEKKQSHKSEETEVETNRTEFDSEKRQLCSISPTDHSHLQTDETENNTLEYFSSDGFATFSESCQSQGEILLKEGDNNENVSENVVTSSYEKKGTEIKLKGLELSENTSTIRANTIALTLECARCKGREDHQTISSRPQSFRCPRCFTIQNFAYRSAIVHSTSNVLGYLDLESCHPFDLVLVNCELFLGCLNCSHETSVKGLCYGSTHRWCSHCHGKLSLQLESTRFYQLQPSMAKLGKQTIIESARPKREPKPPTLKAGQPLPDNGTCKHYKKSYRWLRFPCCGKCYPCDVCHDLVENHEMKFATRMVCGHCSKEQPYSQNPCTGCKASVTKARSSHWEGGKGCRDKVHMSRGDDRKYKSTNKTVSRKAAGKSGSTLAKGKSQNK